MRSLEIKLALSVAIGILVIAAVPVIGLTTVEADSTEGVMIDFGYWDVVWIPMAFEEGMDGNDALEKACEINGFPLVYLYDDKSQVFSVNEQVNLYGMQWNMYVLVSGKWSLAEDPRGTDASSCGLMCWARASGEDGVVPGTDSTGFTYYSYAKEGISSKKGERLRIISLAPSVTEILSSVGGIDLIVGTDLYSNYPKEIAEKKNKKEISVIGGYTDPNYEWIIRLNPDIVFCDGGTGEHINMANKLRKSGLSCVVLYDAVDIETLYDNIWIAAAAIGLEKNANSSITAARATINTITGIIGTQASKRVFVSLSADPSPWTSGSGTFMSDLVSKVSGTNVFDTQSSSWFMVSKEQIHAKQPQVIIIIYEGKAVTSYAEYQSVIDRMDPVWKETPAYRNGDIYIFSGAAADILSRPGPRLAEADELLAKILHPSQFTNMDPLDTLPKYLGDDYRQYLKYQRGAA
ncbi:MAG: helical backbone metal receptor [Methanomassiliicoccaceae archaeon]|nr:helical backbone metal receptor [Methanomassiliicoccaceae archaeon]